MITNQVSYLWCPTLCHCFGARHFLGSSLQPKKNPAEAGSKRWKRNGPAGMFYPLVNIQKTMENHHFQWENPLYMAIFNSYVNLPEGMLQVFHLWPATQQASIGKCRARWSGLPVTEESFRGHAATEVIQLTTDFICIYYVRIIYKPITKNWFMTVYATTTCVHIHNNMYNLQLLAMILILHVDIFS